MAEVELLAMQASRKVRVSELWWERECCKDGRSSLCSVSSGRSKQCSKRIHDCSSQTSKLGHDPAEDGTSRMLAVLGPLPDDVAHWTRGECRRPLREAR